MIAGAQAIAPDQDERVLPAFYVESVGQMGQFCNAGPCADKFGYEVKTALTIALNKVQEVLDPINRIESSLCR